MIAVDTELVVPEYENKQAIPDISRVLNNYYSSKTIIDLIYNKIHIKHS